MIGTNGLAVVADLFEKADYHLRSPDFEFSTAKSPVPKIPC
jgi:hypothetical protein